MADQDDSYYPYTPSKIAGICAAALFGILILVHIFNLFRTRTFFCIPFLIGAIFEAIGFAARAYGHDNPTTLIPYIIQSVLILLAPIFFAASVYMFLGRIVLATGQSSKSMIRPSILTKLFVTGDVICFLIQAAGAGKMVNADDQKDRDSGNYTVLAGLLFQLAIFGFFLIIAAVFHLRVRGITSQASKVWNWQRYLISLYVLGLIITFRNVFRVVEYIMGDDGYLLRHEWPIYVFDAVPMAVVLVLAVDWYVGDIVSKATQSMQNGRYKMTKIEGSRRSRVQV
ncbi:RTA1 like protein [Fusarium avenaceum]|nr:RTA1 like protein [Fusarium avenaceum]